MKNNFGFNALKQPLQETLRKLKSIFPDAVTETQQANEEGKPYYTYAIKEEFIEHLQDSDLFIADDQNRYELQFPNKRAAKALASVPSYKALIADREQSKNFDNTSNLFIEGDNLDALRILQRSYHGKIKMIYIDPPYNTGSDGFVYNDDFSVRQRKYLKVIGAVDDEGERQISQIKDGLQGRFHAGWLAMMYPRLKLARELLSEDGVIFISIDDNEQANLKLICDEIFGEENFVADIIWHKKDNASFLSKEIVNLKEHILFYKKSNSFKGTQDKKINTEKHRELITKPSKVGERVFNKNHTLIEGGRFDGKLYSRKYGSDMFSMEVLNDVDIVKGVPQQDIKIRGRFCWQQDTINKEISNGGRIEIKSIKGMKPVFYKKFTNVPYRPLIDILTKKMDYRIKTNNDAAAEIKQYFKFPIFEYSKPSELIKLLISNISKKEGIILDFFAGSATTAHAVMQLNAEDGGNRKFIMVQWAEKINPKKSKEAHTFCTEELKRPATIAEIAKERIRRAGAKIRTDHPDKQIDDGFRVFTIQNSLLMDNDNRRFDQTEQWELADFITDLSKEKFEPLLYEAILQTGVTLDLWR